MIRSLTNHLELEQKLLDEEMISDMIFDGIDFLTSHE